MSTQLFKPAYIPTPAVFHLHGQHTGFVLMNTEEEVEEHSKRLKPLFDDAGRGRVWVVVGYSGENDPVFEHLAGISEFDYNLYWIGYRDNEPAPHVREKLLSDKRKYAFYVRGFDADDFFVDLAQRLNCFPPGFVGRPFSHLNELLEMLTPYSLLGQSGETDVTASARELIIKAIKQYEEQPVSAAEATQPPLTLSAQDLLLAGKYDQVIALLPVSRQLIPPDLVDPASWAYVGQGNALSDQAQTKSGEEAERLLVQAGEKYQAALQLKPDFHEALNNWGSALSDQAQTKSGEEAERLLVQAEEKYQAALQIKPDLHEALNNWGSALLRQITKSGSDDKNASLFT